VHSHSYHKAEKIKNALQKKGKEVFIFVFDELNAAELENFTFIDFWINTACPRIADDPDKSKIVDMSELEIEF